MGLRSDTHRCRALVYGVERSSYQSTCGTQGGKGDPHHFKVLRFSDLRPRRRGDAAHARAARPARHGPIERTYLLTYLLTKGPSRRSDGNVHFYQVREEKKARDESMTRALGCCILYTRGGTQAPPHSTRQARRSPADGGQGRAPPLPDGFRRLIRLPSQRRTRARRREARRKPRGGRRRAEEPRGRPRGPDRRSRSRCRSARRGEGRQSLRPIRLAPAVLLLLLCEHRLSRPTRLSLGEGRLLAWRRRGGGRRLLLRIVRSVAQVGGRGRGRGGRRWRGRGGRRWRWRRPLGLGKVHLLVLRLGLGLGRRGRGRRHSVLPRRARPQVGRGRARFQGPDLVERDDGALLIARAALRAARRPAPTRRRVHRRL